MAAAVEVRLDGPEHHAVRVPLQGDLCSFLAHCSAAFGVPPEAIVGFTEGPVLWPASLVGMARAEHFAGRQLTVVLDGQRVALANKTQRRAQRRFIRFFLVGNQTVLMSWRDFASVAALTEVLNHQGLEVSGLVAAVMRFREGDMLSKRRFDSLVEQVLCPSHLLGNKSQERRLRAVCERIFFSFDVGGVEQIVCRDFVAALAMIAPGAQLPKFGIMFTLFDRRGEGSLTAKQVSRLIRSLLVLALAFNWGMARLPSSYVYTLVDETSEAIMSSLVQAPQSSHAASSPWHISLQEFSDWYRTSGRVLMPWVEVLSRPKNVQELCAYTAGTDRPASARIEPFVRDSQQTLDTPRHASSRAHGRGGAASTADGRSSTWRQVAASQRPSGAVIPAGPEAVFRFELASGGELTFLPIDADLLDLIVTTTGLHKRSASTVFKTFLEASGSCESENELNKQVFDACIRKLVPGRSLGRQEQVYLSYTFGTLFYAFDRDKAGRVPMDEFLCGFSLLTEGTREAKVACAWDLFSMSRSGQLDSITMVRFLRAFLTMMFAIRKDATKFDAEQIYGTIDATAVKLVRSAYDFLGKHDRDSVSREEFEHWFRVRGRTAAAWLDLLDLHAWPFHHEHSFASESTDSFTRSTNSSVEADGSGSVSASGPAQGEANIARTPGSFKQEDFDDGSDDAFDLDEDDEDEGALAPGEIVFQVPFGSARKDLIEFVGADVMYIENMLGMSDFEKVEPELLYAALARESRPGDGTLSAEAFCSSVRKLLSLDQSDDDGEWDDLEACLLIGYDLFDEKNDERIPVVDIACGISFLAGGNKSDKLAFGFRLYDTDHDGMLSHGEFEQFLLSLILGLFGFSGKVNQNGVAETRQLARTCAKEAAQQVVATASPKSQDGVHGVISFEMFADFYARGGFEAIPWIELYDLQKWPLRPAFLDDSVAGEDPVEPSSAVLSPMMQRAKQRVEGAAIQARTMEGPKKGQSSVILSFQLVDDGSAVLEITNIDVKFVRELAFKSGLATLTPHEIQVLLRKHIGSGCAATPTGFQSLLCSVLDNLDIPDEARQRLFMGFYSIFQTFEHTCQVNAVPQNKLLCGLLIFAAGKKSDKLHLAFAAFDSDGDGALTAEELGEFFSGFLVGLSATHTCSGAAGLLTSEEKVQLGAIHDAAIALGSLVMREANLGDASRQHIEFSEFAEWYTGGGYSAIPWLELLDLHKWKLALEREPTTQQAYTTDSPAGSRGAGADPSGQDSPKEVGVAATDEEDEDDVVFAFELGAEVTKLVFFRSDLVRLRDVLDITRFNQLKPEDIFQAFRAAGSSSDHKDGALARLSKAEFDKVMRKLVPGARLTVEEKLFLSVTLSSVFSAFDRDGTLDVSLIEFCCGFMVLASGSKSDKLALAYDEFTRDSGQVLDAAGLERFLRSFLLMLFALNEEACQAPADEIWEQVDVYIGELVRQILEDVGAADQGLCFSDFATWYTDGGHLVIPWLELLSLRKWPGILQTDQQSKGNDVAQGPEAGNDGSGGDGGATGAVVAGAGAGVAGAASARAATAGASAAGSGGQDEAPSNAAAENEEDEVEDDSSLAGGPGVALNDSNATVARGTVPANVRGDESEINAVNVVQADDNTSADPGTPHGSGKGDAKSLKREGGKPIRLGTGEDTAEMAQQEPPPSADDDSRPAATEHSAQANGATEDTAPVEYRPASASPERQTSDPTVPRTESDIHEASSENGRKYDEQSTAPVEGKSSSEATVSKTSGGAVSSDPATPRIGKEGTTESQNSKPNGGEKAGKAKRRNRKKKNK